MLAARDLVFFREVLTDLGHPLNSPVNVWCDSKSAVDMSIDPVSFKKTKHILRAAEFLRDLVARLVLEVKHTPGKLMIADILTKAVARQLFVKLTELLEQYHVNFNPSM